MPPDAVHALPLGAKALEEIREGLGLADESSAEELFKPSDVQSEIVSFESLDMASRVSDEEFAPPAPVQEAPEPVLPAGPAPRAAQMTPEPVPPAGTREAGVSEDVVQTVTREVLEKMAKDIIERVAWEVIPELAERLIREEIERLRNES